jgi:cation diffusion facilitator family transporter
MTEQRTSHGGLSPHAVTDHEDHGHDHPHPHPHEESGHEDHGHDHPHPHPHPHEESGHEDHGRDHGGHGHDHGDHGHDHPGGIRGFVTSIFKPHSHDTADSTDSALEASAEGIRAVKISLVALGVTAVAQSIVVLMSGSVALLADTIHNFSDAMTALPLWVAFVLSRRAASRRYTYGYGRAEDLAGIFIVLMIALSSALAAWESIDRLQHPRELNAVGVVIVAGFLGFIGNELVAKYRINVGRKIGSAALVADGLHARTDGFTSLAVVVGAIGVLLGFPLADPIVGLLITVAILFVLRGAARDIYRRLMDAVDPELVNQAEAVLNATPDVEGVEEFRLRWIGHRLRAETGIMVNSSKSITEAHDVAENVRHRLLHALPKLQDATVHVSPRSADGRDFHEPLAHHFNAVRH